MLSYRHGFHVGNFADVLKHCILLQIIRLLQKKAKPFAFIDSHAGAGVYSLDSGFAAKNSEHLDGIAKLWHMNDLPPALQHYTDTVKSFDLNGSSGELLCYPGSPALASSVLRLNDRMLLHELHNSDHLLLHEWFGPRNGLQIKNADGLKGLVDALPPTERRGLIFIDPSYEMKTDYEDVVTAIIKAHRRFATGVFALWYPVVDRARTEQMLERLRDRYATSTQLVATTNFYSTLSYLFVLPSAVESGGSFGSSRECGLTLLA
jgi:23S rRNA (adenine2030-N6)-methyltransferase